MTGWSCSGGSRIFLWGGVPTPKVDVLIYYFVNFLPSNVLKWKNLDPKRACIPRVTLVPPMSWETSTKFWDPKEAGIFFSISRVVVTWESRSPWTETAENITFLHYVAGGKGSLSRIPLDGGGGWSTLIGITYLGHLFIKDRFIPLLVPMIDPILSQYDIDKFLFDCIWWSLNEMWPYFRRWRRKSHWVKNLTGFILTGNNDEISINVPWGLKG